MLRNALALVSLALMAFTALQVTGSGEALGQALGEELVDARNIGRAGTSAVSGDSGASVVHNPAGLVRQGGSRLLVGTSIADTDLVYTAAKHPDSPEIASQAPATLVPTLAYHHALRDGRWVIAALLWRGEAQTRLPAPDFGRGADDDVQRLFPHRYGGTSFRARWTQLAVAMGVRASDSVGLGLSVAMRRVEVWESRRLWAGVSGRDAPLDPARDLSVSIQASAPLVPSATAGVLIAPPQIPLEFALSVELRRGTELRSNSFSLAATSSSEFPKPIANEAVAVMTLPDSAVLRGGLRFLGESTFVELGLDLKVVRRREVEAWSIKGAQVVDQSASLANLDTLPALLSTGSQLVLRAAIDYEILSGFLWGTLGYAWQSPATSSSNTMPAFARLGGHRIAAGLLAFRGPYSMALGYSRRLPQIRRISADEDGANVVNPFDSESEPANAGRYRSSSDQLGLSLEVSW